MGEKRKKIYEALVDGATEGHSGSDLYDFLQIRCLNTSGKKIVRAALLALTDPLVNDRNVLDVIYALAIKHRVDEVSPRGNLGDSRGLHVGPLRESQREERHLKSNLTKHGINRSAVG